MEQAIVIDGFIIQTSPFNKEKIWMNCNDGEGMEISKEELNKELNSMFWRLF